MQTTPDPGFNVQRHTPHCMDAPHTHAHLEVNLIQGARMRYATPQGDVWVEPGEITLFWAQFEHQSTQVVGAGEIINLNLPLENFSELHLPATFLSALFSGEMIKVPATAFDHALFTQWVEDLADRPLQTEAQVLEEIGVRLRRMALDGAASGGLNVPPAPDLARLERMTRFVLERFTDRICVDDVAASAGLSVPVARRLFKKYMGMGVHQFVRRMRLAQAHKLLANGAGSVLSVALEVGFSSLSGFYSAFEAVYGVRPGEV